MAARDPRASGFDLRLILDAGAAVSAGRTPYDAGMLVGTAPDAPDLFRVSLDPAPARDFVRRAAELVVAGRPTCPFCGQPIDERGHLCPRTRPELN